MKAKKKFKVRASSLTASYNAGVFEAETPEEACRLAKEDYARSELGQKLKDVRAFRFYTVDKFPYESEQ